jgi:hypothetical protein
MNTTDSDLKAFAARVRPFFELEMRDTAEDLAFEIACQVGIYAKLLRPDTSLAQILAWLRAEELALDIPDALASTPDSTTFRDLVELRARDQRPA